MSSAESFSKNNFPLDSMNREQTAEIELMAIDDVIEQDDVALLKSQLAAAHQLLGYQKDVVHSLTEQIQLKETHLLHAERQVDDLQQNCQSQTVELAEMRAICSDLRSQLKRQIQRQNQVKRTLVPEPARTIGFEIQTPAPARASISFGYESAGKFDQVPTSLTKAPPVEAWSAAQCQAIHEEITFCRKLTTFVVAASSRASSADSEGIIDVPAQTVTRTTHQRPVRESNRHPGVELPRFALD